MKQALGMDNSMSFVATAVMALGGMIGDSMTKVVANGYSM